MSDLVMVLELHSLKLYNSRAVLDKRIFLALATCYVMWTIIEHSMQGSGNLAHTTIELVITLQAFQ